MARTGSRLFQFEDSNIALHPRFDLRFRSRYQGGKPSIDEARARPSLTDLRPARPRNHSANTSSSAGRVGIVLRNPTKAQKNAAIRPSQANMRASKGSRGPLGVEEGRRSSWIWSILDHVPLPLFLPRQNSQITFNFSNSLETRTSHDGRMSSNYYVTAGRTSRLLS